MRESPTLASIIHYLELRSIPYLRVHPVKLASIKVAGKWTTIFTKVRDSQRGAPDLFVWTWKQLQSLGPIPYCVAIETKATRGRQGDAQKDWQKKLEAVGVEYRLVRDAETEIKYLEGLTPHP